jgi:glycosyltransferase involved in cell wall biosynthesis
MRPKFLQRCLESLHEHTQLVHVLIANDGSTDDTAKIADATARLDNVRALQLPHGGANAARQAVLKAIDMSFFTFVDDDDILDTPLAEEIFDAVERHDADLVFGRIEEIK